MMPFKHGEGPNHRTRRKATAEYETWSQIKQRCHNPDHRVYALYGGRGITVCDEWRNDYLQFLADMGRRPGPNLTLERVDNALGYSKGNCIWATRLTQAHNRRDNKLSQADVDAIRQSYPQRTLTELARTYRVSKSNIHAIVNGRTWP